MSVLITYPVHEVENETFHKMKLWQAQWSESARLRHVSYCNHEVTMTTTSYMCQSAEVRSNRATTVESKYSQFKCRSEAFPLGKQLPPVKRKLRMMRKKYYDCHHVHGRWATYERLDRVKVAAPVERSAIADNIAS
jgi:hypothetical protein